MVGRVSCGQVMDRRSRAAVSAYEGLGAAVVTPEPPAVLAA